MFKVIKYTVIDVFRSRTVMAYTALLLLLAMSLFYLGDDPVQSVVSMLHVLLMIIPLLCIVLGTIHFYNSREFIELMVAQPMKRTTVFLGQFIGFSLSLGLALLIGLGLPVALFYPYKSAFLLLLVGLFLTFIFAALSFLASVKTQDKARGIGLALLLWFYFSVLFDGLVLLVVFYLSDYPLEKPVLFLTALNPVDLARVIVLLQLDTAALMGYTGALYQKIFGSSAGVLAATGLMIVWLVLPVLWAVRVFKKKDL